MLGRGDGSFQAAEAYAVDSLPKSVAVGDFNGDGIPDLVTANTGSTTVSILLGRGDGNFQAAQNYFAGAVPSSVAVGDFQGHGHLDLAVSNGAGIQGSSVTILSGPGDGSFQVAWTYAVGAVPVSVLAADLNNDGHLDLAVADSGLSSTGPSTVSVLLGRGDGNFQGAPSYAVGSGDPSSVAIGDFNGDGVPDLAVTIEEGENGSVAILLGKGDGTFQSAGSMLAGAGPTEVSVGDFNGDGKQDLLITNYYQGNPPRNPGPQISGIRVLLGNGDGTFQPALVYRSDLGTKAAAVGDFNGDGILDVAVVNYGWFENTGNTVSILLGKGDGTFGTGQSYVVGTGPTFLAAADFNGDGNLDLAVATGQNVSILLGNGDGTFQTVQSLPSPGASYVAVGDFNGDGKPDLAVSNGLAGGDSAGTVSILLGNGDGTFQQAQNYRVGLVPLTLTVGDFNGDGFLDVAAANRDSATVSILLGKGDGTFGSAQDFSAGSRPLWVVAADFNGDGLTDLAVPNQFSSAVTILINDGHWAP